MGRYELPPDLSPEEERIAIAAIEHVLALERPRLTAWQLSGRAENLRIGSLHVRHQAHDPWMFRGHVPYTMGGTRPQVGRGDSR